MSVHEVIRKRIAGGDTRLLADLRKTAIDAAAAGDYDAASNLWDVADAAIEEAPTTEVQIGAPCEVDIGDGVLILGFVTAVHAEAKMVEVAHDEEFKTANGITFPPGYVSTHPVDAVTVLLLPEPVPEPQLPEPELPPIYDVLAMKGAAGVLVKSALAHQVRHSGPVSFPDRPMPPSNTASDRRRQEEEREAHAHA
jgi:hypothetical protein